MTDITPNFKKKRRKDIENQKKYAELHQFCEWHYFYARAKWPGEQVHHITYRSQVGGDEDENLIMLCALCHRRAHSGLIKKEDLMKIKEATCPEVDPEKKKQSQQ